MLFLSKSLLFGLSTGSHTVSHPYIEQGTEVENLLEGECK